MTALDDLESANIGYVGALTAGAPGRPGRQLAVLTCMDTRIDPLAAFGLKLGDAHVLRNAGGLVTDDALRSLVISQRALGTTEIAVIHHTRCGLTDFDDAAFRAELTQETGEEPQWRGDGFSDPAAQARESADAIRNCVWLPRRDQVRGYVFDIDTGALTVADE